MPTPQLRVRPCVLLASAAVLGAAVVARLIINGDLATNVLVALTVALVAGSAGFVDLLPRSQWTSAGTPAKIGAAVLLAVGAVVPLQLGVSCGPVAVAMALGALPLYLWLALRIDRREREPRRLLVATFLWGACVALSLGVTLESLGSGIVESALGGHAGAIFDNSISPGVVEECAKAAVLVIIYRRFRGEFDGVLDGIVYATIVGLGFATTENIGYYGTALSQGHVSDAAVAFFARGICTPFMHPLLTSLTGVGLGIASRSSKRSTRAAAPLLGLFAAMVLHGLFDAEQMLGEVAGIVIVFLVFVPLFVGMLVFIRRTVKAERRTIARYLAADVEAGRLTAVDVDVLACGRARRRALKAAKRVGGKQARRALAAFHQAAGELALLRGRLAEARRACDAGIAERHERCEARVSELRGQLGSMAVLPAAIRPAPLLHVVVAERPPHAPHTERVLATAVA